jgi:cell division protein FtsW (lipid II flippase)
MGGTSIWFTSIALGMLLSVSREVKTEGEVAEPEPQADLAHA